MPANINEQMHNRSLKTSQFTHKINWPDRSAQACARMRFAPDAPQECMLSFESFNRKMEQT
jgi:hypothetical protein